MIEYSKLKEKPREFLAVTSLTDEEFQALLPTFEKWVVAQEREKSYTLFMVKLKCYHCQSENLVRNGKTNNGKQRYLCNDCGKMSRDNPQSNSYSAEEREQILRAYEERSSLRGLTRTFGVARNTVSGWLREKNS